MKWFALGLAALAAIAAACGAASRHANVLAARPASPRPNVVVIMTDDQTIAEMRALPKTAALVGRRGVTFDNSFVSLSLCCPSRATFLTGQYAHNHGVLGNDPPQGGYQKLDSSNTLAVWLRQAGYYTAHVGKYLNTYGVRDPTEIPPGWSEWHALVDPTTYKYWNYTFNDDGTLSTPEGYQTDMVASKALTIIRERAGQNQPFFMWVAFIAPHFGGPNDPGDPFNFGTPSPAPKYKGRFAATPLPAPPSFDEANLDDKPYAVRRLRPLTQTQIDAITSNYQQELESLLSVDDAVAEIVTTLRQTGQLDNTLLVFTSDNGFFHGEHRIASGKLTPYEPSIRVPLLMRGPQVPVGLHVKKIVANIDLAPTIVAATGAKARRAMDGRSLWPLLRDPKTPWRTELLIERAANEPQVWSGLRTPRYLYAEYKDGEKELYDLAKDPGELASLDSDPSYRALMQKLSTRLARLNRCAGASCRRS